MGARLDDLSAHLPQQAKLMAAYLMCGADAQLADIV